ncbi:MAG: hypothetical protein ABIN89_03420 [Chitinophagaceae bacterium]
MPLYEALPFVRQTLDEFTLSNDIKILAAGKIITGIDILKVLSLWGGGMLFSEGNDVRSWLHSGIDMR